MGERGSLPQDVAESPFSVAGGRQAEKPGGVFLDDLGVIGCGDKTAARAEVHVDAQGLDLAAGDVGAVAGGGGEDAE